VEAVVGGGRGAAGGGGDAAVAVALPGLAIMKWAFSSVA
jgi:hypothetical protein